MCFKMEGYFPHRFLVAFIALFLVANKTSGSILHNDTCGPNLALDCGDTPIVLISVTSSDRFNDECRPGKERSTKVTIEEVGQQCEGKRRCTFPTGFAETDFRYLQVYYDCGQSNDICSDVTIHGQKSYLNLRGQAGVSGPSDCSCKAQVTPGSQVSVKVLKKTFRTLGTKLTLKWRDDVTFYVDQYTDVTGSPIEHVVTDKFEVNYQTDNGNNNLQLYYEASEPITMVCNNGTPEAPAPSPGPVVPGGGENTTNPAKDDHSPVGAIVGAVCAVLFVAFLVFITIVIVKKRKRDKKPRPTKQTDVENSGEAVHKTLTKEPGSEEQTGEERISGVIPEKEAVPDEVMYESITKYGPNSNEKEQGFAGDKASVVIETPTPRKQTLSFSVGESDSPGDYEDVVDDDPKSAVEVKDGERKGLFGWFANKFGRKGAKEDSVRSGTADSVKSKNSYVPQGSGGKAPASQTYHQLDRPLLTSPNRMLPRTPHPNYDHIDPRYDSKSSKKSEFDFEGV